MTKITSFRIIFMLLLSSSFPTTISSAFVLPNQQRVVPFRILQETSTPPPSSFSSSSSSSSSSHPNNEPSSSLILTGLNEIYPPTTLESRNAISRTDGYWTYISKNEEPPLEYTYGEFDLEFFASLLQRAANHHYINTSQKKTTMEEKTFLDIGSGSGRLVLGAAALYSWKECRGIEILDSLHRHALQLLEQHCRRLTDSDTYELPIPDASSNTTLPLSPIQLISGSFSDPYQHLLDVDIAFVFSSCMSSEILSQLAVNLGRQCRIGTIVITTDYSLPLKGVIPPLEDDPTMPHGTYELELLETLDGHCDIVGGISTAYIHRIKQSLHVGKREKPRKSKEEEAYQIIKQMEQGELSDEEEFLRKVRNDMMFHGLPEEWLPNLDS